MMNTIRHYSNRWGVLFLVLLLVSLLFVIVAHFKPLTFFRTKPVEPTVTLGTLSFPRELHDAAGEKLIIPSRPQRIVSQTLGTDEILLAICPPQRLVAVSTLAREPRYSNVVDEAQQIAGQVGDSVEHILSFKPDLIFVASYSRAETVELLQATGAPVFRFSQFRNVEDIKTNIKIIGYAIGAEQPAAALITQIENDIQAIQAQIPANLQPPRVMSYSLGNYTAGRHTTFDNMVNLVGAINVATEHGIEQHVKISDEQILAWQPDFIVTHAAKNEFEWARRQLLQNPAIAASQAGKAGRIIVIENRYFAAVSQYIVLGIQALAEGLYSISPDFSVKTRYLLF